MMHKKKGGFLRDTSIYFGSTVFTIASSFLLMPVYTRHLSPSDYGIFVLFTMFGNLSSNVLSMSLHYVSFIEYFELKGKIEKFRTVNSTNFIFLCIIFLSSFAVVIPISGWISNFFFEDRLAQNLIILAFISGCLEYFYLYFLTLLNAEEAPIKYAAINIIRICLSAAIALVLLFKLSLTYMALIYSVIISQLVIGVILFWMTKHLFSVSFSLVSLKKSLKIAFPLLPNSLMGLVYSSFDKTMLNKLRDSSSVSYFSFGERFALSLKAMQDATSKSWNPYFLRGANENTESAKRAIVERYYELTFLYMLIGILIIYFSEELIRMLTTEAFYPSMYVLPLSIYYYIFASLGTLSMNQIAFSRKLHFVLPSTLLGLVSNLALNLILIPRYGALGAAGATATSALLTNLLSLYFGMRLHPLPLGKFKLLSMYILLIVFTIPIYPIMAAKLHFAAKITLKLLLFASFCFAGYYLKFVSRGSIALLRGKLRNLRLAANNT